jgi:DNA-binding MarR family transcriptional regulator
MMDTAMTRTELRDVHYRALADFRYQIRRFLSFSERAARAAGLEPRQHQALLALKGLPEDQKATVGVLAERLQIEHHTAVELADRLVAKGLIIRSKSQADRREVLLHLTRRGENVLRELSLSHHAELSSAGPKLLQALETAVRLAGKFKKARRLNSKNRAGKSKKRPRHR